MVLEYKSNSKVETEKIAKLFAESIKPFDFISLNGPLGAGKTAFVGGFASFFCSEFKISSPTFAIMNKYLCAININHFDFYRLKTVTDLETCGFFDALEENAITIAEWSDRFSIDYKRYIGIDGNYFDVKIDFGNQATGTSYQDYQDYENSERYITIERL